MRDPPRTSMRGNGRHVGDVAGCAATNDVRAESESEEDAMRAMDIIKEDAMMID